MSSLYGPLPAASMKGFYPSDGKICLARLARPVLAFNPHGQFERLRNDGRYARMRDVIRRRDQRLQGTINPVVRDHGTESEARQYSGQPVGSTWEPPE